MLSKIKLKNFQGHENLELDLGRISVVYGNSDTGKSSLIRSASMLYNNNFGFDMVRHGEKALKVSHIFDDGSELSIEKGENLNKFTLKINGQEKVFSKVGREVPEEIQEFLKTQPLILDRDLDLNLNFYLQFPGSPFLLSDSSSVVTKTVSALSGIHYIYAALREAASQAFKIKSKVAVLEEAEDSLEKYEVLIKQEEILEHDYNTVEKQISFLTQKQNKIKELESKKDRLDYLNTKNIDTSAVKTTKEKIQVVLNKLAFDNNKIINYGHLLERIKKLKNIDGIMVSEARGLLDFNRGFLLGTKEKIKLIEILEKYKSNFEKADYSINTIIGELAKYKVALVALQEMEKEEKNKIKVCSLCGKPL